MMILQKKKDAILLSCLFAFILCAGMSTKQVAEVKLKATRKKDLLP